MALSVAIDFTESNLDPSNPASLHNADPAKNQYLQALQAVGSVLEPYDSDKKIPCFGFGGIPTFLPDKNPAQFTHCFPLNANPEDPEIDGLAQLIKTYLTRVGQVRQSGPTRFAPVLREFIKSAQKLSFHNTTFNVLLMLTDGDIHDMRETKSLIVAASELPVSIVIVGLGQAESFKNMDILDSDDFLLRDDFGKVAKRDIV